jgi:hypothetical protein
LELYGLILGQKVFGELSDATISAEWRQIIDSKNVISFGFF